MITEIKIGNVRDQIYDVLAFRAIQKASDAGLRMFALTLDDRGMVRAEQLCESTDLNDMIGLYWAEVTNVPAIREDIRFEAIRRGMRKAAPGAGRPTGSKAH